MTNNQEQLIEMLSKKYELDISKVTQALQKIASDEVILLAVSGKLGSGKDTVAPLVLDKIGKLNRINESFARPLKEEATQVIKIVASAKTPEAAAEQVAEELTTDYQHAFVVVNFVWTDVKSGLVTDSKVRVDSTRRLLQYWGTEVRRAQDDNYWVKRALISVFENLSEGRSVFLTDARFPNEIDAVQMSTGKTVRLVVSDEEQARRIFGRDGIEISELAKKHISETSLNTYEQDSQFDVIVDTDTIKAEAVATLVAQSISNS